MRSAVILTVCLSCAASLAAQTPPIAPAEEEKGTFLGVLFSPVAEALYDQLPNLPRNQGVLVTHVLPDSPSTRADLRRHDILLQYGDKKIRNCEDFARMIHADQPETRVKLVLLRAGREMTVEVTLGLGPVLRIASANKTPGPRNELPRGVAKPGTTAAISIVATPLEQGQMKVTIEFYQDGTGRLRTIACEGSPAVIDGEVLKLPAPQRTLVQDALQRIRAKTQTDDKPSTPAER